MKYLIKNIGLVFILVGTILTGNIGHAQLVPELIKDINLEVNETYSGIRFIGKLNDNILFTTGKEFEDDSPSWEESSTSLYVLKASEEVVKLKFFYSLFTSEFLKLENEEAYIFIANDGIYGESLWRTDGTEDGTYRLTRTSQSPTSLDVFGDMIQFGNQLIFSWNKNGLGFEPYLLDLHSESVIILKDIYPSVEGSKPSDFTLFKDELYFSATQSEDSRELWVSDGTTAGTKLFIDIDGVESGDPHSLKVIDETLYFTATEDAIGENPWVSDGTINGTKRLLDLGGYFNSDAREYHIANNHLFFLTNRLIATNRDIKNEIWSYNFEDESLYRIEELQDVFKLRVLGSQLLFTAEDGYGYTYLYGSDGTREGSVELYGLGGSYNDLEVFNNEAYLTTKGSFGGLKRLIDDSWDSSLESIELKDISEGGINDLFIDGSELIWVRPRSLFKYSNSSNETIDLANEDLDAITLGSLGYEEELYRLGSYVFFVADIWGHDELWVTDGSKSGTNSMGISGAPTNAIDNLLFLRNSEEDHILVDSNDLSITNISSSLVNGINGDNPKDLKEFDLEAGVSRQGNTYLHFTKGYAEHLIVKIGSDKSVKWIRSFSDSRIEGFDLWIDEIVFRVSGTEGYYLLALTESDHVYSLFGESEIYITGFEVSGDNMFIAGNLHSSEYEENLYFVKDRAFKKIASIENMWRPYFNTVWNDQLVFITSDSDTHPIQYHIWLSDGTEEGTKRITTEPFENYGFSHKKTTQSAVYFGDEDLGLWRLNQDLEIDFIDSSFDLEVHDYQDDKDIIVDLTGVAYFLESDSKTLEKPFSVWPFQWGSSSAILNNHLILGLDDYKYGNELHKVEILEQSPQTITFASIGNKVFGDPNFTLNATSDSGLEVTFSSSNTSVATISENEVTIVGAGSTVITASQLGNDQFASAEVSQTLTVTQATLTATAEGKSKTYGDANPEFTITYDGFVNGDDVTFVTEPTVETIANATSDVGNYDITLTGGSATNYIITNINGILTINKRPITVAADAKSKVYGEDDPALTYQITSGSLVNSDAITGALSRTTGEDVNDYAINQNTLTAGSNYDLTYISNDLTISKATLTATAEDKSKTYGEANPTLTISYSGFVNGDDETAITEPSISTIAGKTSIVGDYNITLTGGSSDNYDLSILDGVLTVTKAPLSVTVQDETINKGDAIPEFSISYNGFVNSEDESVLTTTPTAGTSANSTSDRGTYTIELSDGSAVNYTVNTVDGTLTVTGPVYTLPSTISFTDPVVLGDTETETIVLDNTGDGALNVTGIAVPSGYGINQTSLSVSNGSNTTLTLTFTPTAAQTYAGDIIITSNNGEDIITVTGEGQIVTGIDDDRLDLSEVKVYPNPSDKWLTIDLSDSPSTQANLMLLDPQGKTAWQKEEVSDREIRVNTSTFSSGFYLLIVQTDKGSIIKKVMVQH